jgi:N-acetylneuraminic acid mutarotase
MVKVRRLYVVIFAVHCAALAACSGSQQDHVAGGTARVVLFGGFVANDGQSLRDTWTWSPDSWTQQHVTGPSARSEAAIATLNGTVVLFGGTHRVLEDGGLIGDRSLGDTWTYDGTSWTQQGVTGPGARSGAGMATLNDSIVLFGGIADVYPCGGPVYPEGPPCIFPDDTWTWDARSWTKQTLNGPSGRSSFALAALGKTVVLFGGQDAHGDALGDTWTWDGASWTRHEVTGPSARSSAAMASLDNTAVLFGGAPETGQALDDTWTWDGASWKRQEVTGPSARYDATMVTLSGMAVLFGGFDDHTGDSLSDTWTWDGATWTQQDNTGPNARSSAAMATVAGP